MSVACFSCRTELGRHYFSGSQSQAVMTVSHAVAERINVRHMTIVFQKFVAIPAPKNSSSADHESSLHRNVVIVIGMTILYATTKEIIQSSSSHSIGIQPLLFKHLLPSLDSNTMFLLQKKFRLSSHDDIESERLKTVESSGITSGTGEYLVISLKDHLPIFFENVLRD